MENQNEVPMQEIPSYNFQVNDKLLDIACAKFVPPLSRNKPKYDFQVASIYLGLFWRIHRKVKQLGGSRLINYC